MQMTKRNKKVRLNKRLDSQNEYLENISNTPYELQISNAYSYRERSQGGWQ